MGGWFACPAPQLFQGVSNNQHSLAGKAEWRWWYGLVDAIDHSSCPQSEWMKNPTSQLTPGEREIHASSAPTPPQLHKELPSVFLVLEL